MSAVVSISFFTPISREESNPSFLERVDGYFHLFQKVAKVNATPDSKKLQITRLEDQRQPVYMIALKIASYITLVIPLIMLIMKAIIRSRYEIDSQLCTTAPNRSSPDHSSSLYNSMPSGTVKTEANPSTNTKPLQAPKPLPLINQYASVDLGGDPIYIINEFTKKYYGYFLDATDELIGKLRNRESVWTDLSPVEKNNLFDFYGTILTLIGIIKPSEFLSLYQNIDQNNFPQYTDAWTALAVYGKIKYSEIPEVVIKEFKFEHYCILIHKKIIKLNDVPRDKYNEFTVWDWMTLVGYKIVTLKGVPENKQCDPNDPDYWITLVKYKIKKFSDIPETVKTKFNGYNWRDLILYGIKKLSDDIQYTRLFSLHDWLNFAQFKRVNLEKIPENIQQEFNFRDYFIDKIKEGVFNLNQLPSHAVNAITPDNIIKLHNEKIIQSINDLPDSIKKRYDGFTNNDKNDIQSHIKAGNSSF